MSAGDISMMRWNDYDPYSWWGGIYKEEQDKYIRQTNKVLKEVTAKEIIENVYDEISKSLEDNIILLEPSVQVKIYHLMAIGGKKEIYAKCVTAEEGGYIVVKDLMIPYQTVGGSAFKSYDDQLSKWLFELRYENNDPMKDEDGKAHGEKREQEEIDALKQSLNGHWHSHNSVSRSSKPSPSTTDTGDMRENRHKRKYWIELISSFAGTSGRLMMDAPKIEREVEVKMKWWSGIDKTLRECGGKIFTEETTYTTVKKESEEKSQGGKEGNKKKQEDTIPVIKQGFKPVNKYDRNLKRGIWKTTEQLDKVNEGENREELMQRLRPKIDYTNQKIMDGNDNDWIAIEWLESDPLQLGETYMDKETQQMLAQAFKKIIGEDEEIVIEVHPDNLIAWMIYKDGQWEIDLLSRFEKIYPIEYSTYLDILAGYGLSEDATEADSEGIDGEPYYYPTVRTINWKEATDLAYNIMIKEDSEKTVNEIIAEEVKEEIKKLGLNGEL